MVLKESSEAVFQTRLAASDSQVHLFCLSTAEGPISENQTLIHSVWDGNAWTSPAAVLDTQPLQAFDAVIYPNGNALLIVGRPNGELLDIRWDGNTWSAPKLIEEKTDPAVSLALDSNQRAVLVWQDRETQGLKMSFLEPGADDWTEVGEVVTIAQARQGRVLALMKDGSIKYCPTL